MSDVHYVKHRVFRETNDVIFYDISVENSNASDLVVHTGSAVSPPDDVVGAKQIGMKTIFARYGDTFGTNDSGADWDVNDIYEVIGIIKELNNV